MAYQDLTSKEVTSQLRPVAEYHGYIASRGPHAGQGSLVDFILAIGCGEIATVLLPDEQRSMLLEWLNQQAPLVEDISLQEAIQSVSRQIFESVKRERQAERDEMFDEEEIHQGDEETHSS